MSRPPQKSQSVSLYRRGAAPILLADELMAAGADLVTSAGAAAVTAYVTAIAASERSRM